MSIRTRSTSTLLARLQELQEMRREEEEILTELRQRAAGIEPQEPNFQRFPVAGGGNQRPMSGHAREAELSGLTFMDNQEAPHWQVADWPPLPFESEAIHASVVVNDPAATIARLAGQLS